MKALAQEAGQPFSPQRKAKESRLQYELSRHGVFYLMALPAFLILVVINIFPLIYSLFVSLTSYSLTKPDVWRFVGLQNFIKAVGDPMVQNAFFNTTKYTLGATLSEFLVGLGLALLLNRLRRLNNLLLALFMLPMMLTPVIVGLQWRFLFNHSTGLVNYLLDALGLGRIPFLANSGWALPSLIIADIWQWTPFVLLLIYSGLQALPEEPYEAASIDGASEFQKFRYITLPSLQNTILIVLLIRGMDALREYDKVFTMTYGGPGSATETASFHIYLQGFKHFNTGYASAVSYLLLIVTVFIIQTALARRSRAN